MATPNEIAERAMGLAQSFLVNSREEIAGMVAGDGGVLYDASQIVRKCATGGPHAAFSTEHLAFSLIAAAHELLRSRAAPGRPAEQAGPG